MNVTLNSTSDLLMAHSVHEKSGNLYDIIMVAMFALGLILLKLILFYSQEILNFFMRRKIPVNENNKDIAVAALNILRQTKGTPNIKNSNPAAIQQLIHDIKELPHVEPLEVLNRIQRIGVFPDVSVYNTLLDTCITAKHFQTAYQLFMEIKEPTSLISPDVNTYNIYIKGIIEAINSGGHVNINMIDDLLKEMRSREISPNVVTFNTILEVCSISGDSSRAWEYFAKMHSEYRIEPDPNTYGIIVKGIRTSDKVSHYFELFFPSLLGFIATKTELVEDTFINGIVDICGKFRCVDKIEQMTEILRRKNRKLNLVTYGKLITIYRELKQPYKIDDLCREIKKCDIQPNEITYGCIMEAYFRCDLYDKVIEIYEEVQNNIKIACNIVIYTTYIRALAKKSDFETAIGVYSKLKNDPKCKLNRIAFNALLDCCVKCGRYDKMTEIFEEMLRMTAESQKIGILSEEEAVAPDLITYSTLIKGMCKAKRIKKAIELYEEMKKKGMELDEILFNSLLDGFVNCEENNFVESEKVINDMKKLKIKFSNYTYSILIKLYGKNYMIEKALGVLDEMKKSGVQPGVIVYTCLIQVCRKNKMIDRAIEFYKEMRVNNIQPDKTAYNIIVGACVYSGKLLAACEILSQAMNENIILKSEVYNDVMRNFSENNKMTPTQKHQYATAVYNYVNLHKIPVNEGIKEDVYYNFVENTPTNNKTYSTPNYYTGYYQSYNYGYSNGYYQDGYSAQSAHYHGSGYMRKDARNHK